MHRPNVLKKFNNNVMMGKDTRNLTIIAVVCSKQLKNAAKNFMKNVQLFGQTYKWME